MISNRKKVVVGATLGLLAFSSGLAAAYYNAKVTPTSLAGGASVSAQGPQNITATLADPATDGAHGLVPGASATLTLTLTNPNAYTVGLGQTLSLDTANLVSPTHPACSAAEAALSAVLAGPLPSTIPATGTAPVAFTVTMDDAPLDQSDCIGATFTIPVTVS